MLRFYRQSPSGLCVALGLQYKSVRPAVHVIDCCPPPSPPDDLSLKHAQFKAARWKQKHQLFPLRRNGPSVTLFYIFFSFSPPANRCPFRKFPKGLTAILFVLIVLFSATSTIYRPTTRRRTFSWPTDRRRASPGRPSGRKRSPSKTNESPRCPSSPSVKADVRFQRGWWENLKMFSKGPTDPVRDYDYYD